MDVLEHLIDEHRQAEQLIAPLAASQPGLTRASVFAELLDALDLHMEVEEDAMSARSCSNTLAARGPKRPNKSSTTSASSSRLPMVSTSRPPTRRSSRSAGRDRPARRRGGERGLPGAQEAGTGRDRGPRRHRAERGDQALLAPTNRVPADRASAPPFCGPPGRFRAAAASSVIGPVATGATRPSLTIGRSHVARALEVPIRPDPFPTVPSPRPAPAPMRFRVGATRTKGGTGGEAWGNPLGLQTGLPGGLLGGAFRRLDHVAPGRPESPRCRDVAPATSAVGRYLDAVG